MNKGGGLRIIRLDQIIVTHKHCDSRNGT
jgi:hypothetical protein